VYPVRDEWFVGVVRLGVTLSERLLTELDEIVKKVGYPSRSKAIQDSVEFFVTEHRWLREQKGERTGVIVLVYDHEVRGVEDYLTDTEHEYSSVICSSTHIHLTKRDCLEAIVVRGEAPRIRDLSERLRTRRGVKQAKLTVVSQ